MSSQRNRFVFGMLLILAGLLWLLDNLNVLPYTLDRYIFTWEAIFIFVGLALLLKRPPSGIGWIFLVIGAFFILNDWIDFHFNFWTFFWPTVLILIGLGLLFQSRRHGNDGTKGLIEGALDDFTLLGGNRRNVRTDAFKGGKVSALFGGGEYNFAESQLAPGDQVLDVFCMFGGIKLNIPSDWEVDSKVQAVLGGYDDNRAPGGVKQVGKKLVLTGFVMFGGVEIT